MCVAIFESIFDDFLVVWVFNQNVIIEHSRKLAHILYNSHKICYANNSGRRGVKACVTTGYSFHLKWVIFKGF